MDTIRIEVPPTDWAVATVDWEKVLASAKAELEQWNQARKVAEENLDKVYGRIEVLNALVYQLSWLTGQQLEGEESIRFLENEVLDEEGMSETVVKVLQAAERPLSVPEIKQRMEATVGWGSRRYTNLHSNIHTVVGRLVKQGRAREIFRDGRRFEIVLQNVEREAQPPKEVRPKKRIATLARERAGKSK